MSGNIERYQDSLCPLCSHLFNWHVDAHWRHWNYASGRCIIKVQGKLNSERCRCTYHLDCISEED